MLIRRRSISGKLAAACATSFPGFLAPCDHAIQSSRVSNPGPQAIQSSTRKRVGWADLTSAGGVPSSKLDRMFPPPKIPNSIYFVARYNGRQEIKDCCSTAKFQLNG